MMYELAIRAIMLCNKPSPDLRGSKITGFYFWIVLPQAKGWLNLAPIGFKSADYVYSGVDCMGSFGYALSGAVLGIFK